ncbi:MAG: competence/damage-inducible protein A [Sporomusaceae bacterium]|nr:competence/damage-inducible protein A [Sporomusaceae bacterium]
MIAEIISTGTELLLGQIVNTNAQYLASKLNELGVDVLYQSTVGDNRDRMREVFAHALRRADILVTTGGLGPTLGDITKEVAAQLLGKPLTLHNDSEERIRKYFAARNLPMPERNLRQAMIPEGAVVLANERGTAPGVIIEENGKTIIHLPGPPQEMHWMFDTAVIPYFRQRFGLQPVIASRVLRTFGVGESALEEKIHDLVLSQGNPTLALLARSGEVHLRITAKDQTAAAVQERIAALERALRSRIGDAIFGVDEETLELVAGRTLTERNLTIALAESCTGGLISSRLTDIAGSSAYLAGSMVSYSNQVKQNALGVPADVLAACGAVSEQTALAMARQARRLFMTDIGIGVTGIAGPGGATATKPVGLVYVAVAGAAASECRHYHFSGVRTAIKQRTANAALFQLIRFLDNKNGGTEH